MSNVIMRPVWNRPEMLALSLEYEIKAREKWELMAKGLITLFIVEYGADEKTLELIKKYPFNKKFIIREKKFGLTPNILEGMKVAFDLSSDYIIYIEDDILLHEDYFLYMDSLTSLVGSNLFSVLSPYTPDDFGDIREINKDNRYAALAPLISKDFFENFVRPNATPNYYRSPASYCVALNKKYKDYWPDRIYKFTDSATHEQAGLINRLVDVAVIEEDRYIYMPRYNRQQHIGYFGKNRPGGTIPGNSYEERLSNLRKIILDAGRMYDLSATKQYNDYRTFSPKLNDWDGTLFLKDYTGTAHGKDSRNQ